MNKKGLVLAAFVVLISLVATVALAGKGPGGVAVSKKEAMPKSFAAAAAYGDNTVIYPGDRSIIEYNYVTGTSKALSPAAGPESLALSDSFSVSADKKYILFRNLDTPSVDSTFFTTLQDAGLNTLNSYWWVYDVDNQKFRPLPEVTVTTAAMDGNNLYALTYNDNGNTIVTYDLATLTLRKSIRVIASTSFFVAKDGFLLQSENGTIYATKDGVVNLQVLETTTIAGVTADKSTAIAMNTQGESKRLVAIDLQDWSVKNLAENLVNEPVWRSPGLAAYITNSNETDVGYKLSTYDATTGKTTAWLTDDLATATDNTSSFVPQVLLSNTTAVVSDTSGNYYLLGDNVHAFKAP